MLQSDQESRGILSFNRKLFGDTNRVQTVTDPASGGAQQHACPVGFSSRPKKAGWHTSTAQPESTSAVDLNEPYRC